MSRPLAPIPLAEPYRGPLRQARRARFLALAGLGRHTARTLAQGLVQRMAALRPAGIRRSGGSGPFAHGSHLM